MASEVRIPEVEGDSPQPAIDLSETVYYADGTRAGVEDPDTGYWISRYIGSLIYSGEYGEESLDGIQTADGFIEWNGTAANAQMQYFLRDHLGSVRVIATDKNNVLSRTDYLPFGVRMTGNGLPESASERSAWFGFSGKENELWDGANAMLSDPIPHWSRGERYQHFGARAYDPLTCIFMQIDPLCEKYYFLSPYAYCAGNPVNYVDPEGKKLFFAKGSTEAFKKSFAEAIKIMNEKGTSYNIAKLEASDQKFYIQQSKNNQFDPNDLTIKWNPYAISINDETGILRSPLTSLAHEVGHANNYRNALESETTAHFIENAKHNSDSKYDTIEDKNVITSTEQYAARHHGEITGDQYTRQDHQGHFIQVNKHFESMQDILNFVINYNVNVVILDSQ